MGKLLKLTVRGGGISGFSKYRIPDSDNKKNISNIFLQSNYSAIGKTVNVVSESALEGIIYYLCGEVSKVSELKKNKILPEVSKMVRRAKFKILSENPDFEMFACRYDKVLTVVNSPNLNEITLQTSTAMHKHSAKELFSVFRTYDLGEIYRELYEDKNAVNGITPKDKAFSKKLDEVIANCNSLLKGNKSCSFYLKTKEKAQAAKTELKTISQNVFGLRAADLIVSPKVVEAWLLVLNRCKQNKSYREELESIRAGASFLCKTKKTWTEPKYVTTGVEYLFNVDYQVYIKDVPESIIQRLVEGPGMATWGKGGGIVEYVVLDNDNSPDELVDSIKYSLKEKIFLKD